MPDTYDIAIDFMDMTDERRLWPPKETSGPASSPSSAVMSSLATTTTTPTPRVARIVSVDSDGNVELEVLPGAVDAHPVPGGACHGFVTADPTRRCDKAQRRAGGRSAIRMADDVGDVERSVRPSNASSSLVDSPHRPRRGRRARSTAP